MSSFSLGIRGGDVEERTRQRLIGGPDRQVVWRSGEQSVLLRRDLVRVRLLRGWLVVGIDLTTTQTGRCPLQLVYFLGDDQRGDGATAAVRINAGTPDATALAEIWGADLQRVVWDAVLDAVQAALVRATNVAKGQPVTLRGFRAADGALQVDIVTGAL